MTHGVKSCGRVQSLVLSCGTRSNTSCTYGQYSSGDNSCGKYSSSLKSNVDKTNGRYSRGDKGNALNSDSSRFYNGCNSTVKTNGSHSFGDKTCGRYGSGVNTCTTYSNVYKTNTSRSNGDKTNGRNSCGDKSNGNSSSSPYVCASGFCSSGTKTNVAKANGAQLYNSTARLTSYPSCNQAAQSNQKFSDGGDVNGRHGYQTHGCGDRSSGSFSQGDCPRTQNTNGQCSSGINSHVFGSYGIVCTCGTYSNGTCSSGNNSCGRHASGRRSNGDNSCGLKSNTRTVDITCNQTTKTN